MTTVKPSNSRLSQKVFDDIKVTRTTYEKYDEITNNSSKEPPSNKWN